MSEQYEAIFIIKLGMQQNTITEISDFMKANNLIILKERKIGIKKLLYKIEDIEKGYYYFVNFKTCHSVKNIKDKLSRQINTIAQIIKYKIIEIK